MDHVSSTSSPFGSRVIVDLASSIPGEGELSRRIELEYPALQAVLLAEAGRLFARRVRQLAVAPDELERRADLHLHCARGEPLAAQVALGEVGPDALDRPGQQALDLHRGGLGQRAVGVEGSRVRSLSSPWWGRGRLREGDFSAMELRPLRAGAVRERRGDRSRSVRRRSAIRGRWRAGRDRGGTSVGPAAHLAPDQPGVLERLDVLRGGGERDRERLGKLPDRALPAGARRASGGGWGRRGRGRPS